MKRFTLTAMVRYELKVLIRSRSLHTFTLLFFGMAFLLYAYGMESTGSMTAANPYSRTIAMLMNLSLWILPIICLIMGVNSIVADKEEGRLALYRTYQQPLGLYLTSKYIALCLALSVAVGFSYGIFGLILYMQGQLGNVHIFTIFLLLNVFLIGTFCSLALFIGAISRTRMQGLSLALAGWSLLLFVYDFLVFAMLPSIPFAHRLNSIFVLILMNPIESIRVWAIERMGASYIFGPEYLIIAEWGQNGALTPSFLLSLFVLIGCALMGSTFAMRRRTA